MIQPAVRERRKIEVMGIVQGVGFRPFVYSLAQRHGLTGWVRNDVEGVQIEIEGSPTEMDRFLRAIETEPPPLAVVEHVFWRPCPARGEREFRIQESQGGKRRNALLSPDCAVCTDCLRELTDPADRRYRYPFINCTNCGPRFTITRSVPYDRAMTTMAGFPMCAACLHEYEDPSDRRFHAQPNACPHCGPKARLCYATGRELLCADAVSQAAALLKSGAILAVKGLGGYHLACNPFNRCAVDLLRERKARQDKPFALMVHDLDQARSLCRIRPEEETLLLSPARPIVLLERRPDSGVAAETAPRQRTLGIMLAYTPLHHLLLNDVGFPLVMTSGNRSDEPIAYQDDEALSQLGSIADYFLIHNRPIHMRCDDSIARVSSTTAHGAGNQEGWTPGTPAALSIPSPPVPTLLRRSRGYAPAPLRMVTRFPRHILACGGELKNTFCLAKEDHVFLSHHIGDLENYETLRSFRDGIEHYGRLFDIQPELVAFDLHPEYLSTKYARELEEQGMPVFGVQHHHAHIAACLADNGRPDDECVIGVAMDGTGYGTDGAIWGGEFLVGSIAAGFARRAHLANMPLPGGEAAIRQPWRTAIAQLIRLYGEAGAMRLALPLVAWAGERNIHVIAGLQNHHINTPLTSSAGRLFDAVAAIVEVPGSKQTTYEGQAAIELEIAAYGVNWSGHGYPFHLRSEGENWVVDTDVLLRSVAEDAMGGKAIGEIAARFHRTLAEIVVATCMRIRAAHSSPGSDLVAVALSGGTFQNRLLLEQTAEMLAQHGFCVHQHRRVPTNDGGICLGQAVLANRHLYRQDGRSRCTN
jgi:hydrogenase maturation protein HypF